MDVTKVLMHELETALGVPCFPAVPADRPETFIIVQRTGGSRGEALSKPNVAVQSWSATEQGASELAERVDGTMRDLPYGNSGVTHVGRGEPYPFPSVEKIPRYQALYSLTVHN